MKPITVLIVDDSALIRQLFTEMLSAEPDIRVLDTASDPYDAREKIKRLNPDVLTLDIEMPKMDGLSFLEKIMTLRPMPVIMCSSLTQKGAEATIRALEIGAFDTVAKPAENQNRQTLTALREELAAKIRGAASANLSARRAGSRAVEEPQVLVYRPPLKAPVHCIGIGSSTGGVEALRAIFTRLPGNLPPIVIAQHMPPGFTTSFAARLDGLSQVKVGEAAHHARLQPGHAYLAPGDRHLRIVRLNGELVCKLEDGPPVSGHRPSVDTLFYSLAEAVGEQAMGVILTGMGKDGAHGLSTMRTAGAYTIGQNQESCVVYGMPQVAARLGAVARECHLLDIPAQLVQACEGRRV